jgi:hypothetical protein
MSTKNDTAYIYQAIKRKKENDQKQSIRYVCYDDDGKAIPYLKRQTQGIKGKWRIYRSVNPRDVRKAKLELMHVLSMLT